MCSGLALRTLVILDLVRGQFVVEVDFLCVLELIVVLERQRKGMFGYWTSPHDSCHGLSRASLNFCLVVLVSMRYQCVVVWICLH